MANQINNLKPLAAPIESDDIVLGKYYFDPEHDVIGQVMAAQDRSAGRYLCYIEKDNIYKIIDLDSYPVQQFFWSTSTHDLESFVERKKLENK